jgi:high-affinity iron transporter
MRINQNWQKYGRVVMWTILGIASVIVLGALVWQGITASGNPDPTTPGLNHTAVIMNTGLLVFREGLEAILVIAALTASFMGSNKNYRLPVALGAGVALLASVATWFIAIAVLNAVDAPALDIQAATGLLAIVVLLIVMNWFFHKVYWTGWISMHNNRKRDLLSNMGDTKSRVMLGLALLGFSAMYREGFEVVLFLQSMRLQSGATVVLQGVAIGLAFTAVVGVLTFVAHQHLPYKKMLILTGIMLAGVLVVMVGENIQEMQLAHWISTTPVNISIPDWMGLWFAVFPNWETIGAQLFAVVAVIGSYLTAEYMKVLRPRKRGEVPAHRPESAPA